MQLINAQKTLPAFFTIILYLQTFIVCYVYLKCFATLQISQFHTLQNQSVFKAYIVCRNGFLIKLIYICICLVYTKDDQVAALASFDNYYDLLILMDPNPLEEKLVQLKFFPDGEQPLRSNQGAGSNMVHIEKLLKKTRIVIVHEGAAKFIKLITIVSQEKPYDELAYHLVGKTSLYIRHRILDYIVILCAYVHNRVAPVDPFDPLTHRTIWM